MKNHQLPRIALAIVFSCVLAVTSSSEASEPTIAEVLNRLEQTERELAETRSELDALQQRDVQRQQFEKEVLWRLPAAEENDRFIAASSEWSVHSGQPMPPAELEAQLEQLGQSVQQLGEGMEQLKEGTEELGKALRITTLDENIKIGVFGWVRGELVMSDERPLLPGAPFFLSPDSGLDQNTVDVHGKSSGIGAGIEGPCICGYESGGLILIYFFGDTVLNNSSGVFLAQAFGELKNDYERIAFGVQADIFCPRNPTVVNWAMFNNAGNPGYLRGQLRYERYIKPNETTQWTLIGGVSNPSPNNLFTLDTATLLREGNGWPNVEGRVALGLGCEYMDGLEKRRPFEVGLSGVVGEIRSTAFDLAVPTRTRVVDDVWGVGVDLRWAINCKFGVQGEIYKGRGLGTYAGTIGQIVNPVALNSIDSEGAWGEVYYYVTPCLHTHIGYAYDDVDNADVAIGQRTYNRAIFANLMWDVTKNYQVAFEVSHWRTDWVAAPAQFIFGDNEGMVYHFRMQYAF